MGDVIYTNDDLLVKFHKLIYDVLDRGNDIQITRDSKGRMKILEIKKKIVGVQSGARLELSGADRK